MAKRRASRAANAGYTLLELLAYIFVLAIIVNLSTSAFLSARRVHTLGMLSVERMEAVHQIGRDFQESVAAAEAVEGELPGLRVSRATLALRTRSAGEDASEYSIWRLDDAGVLYRERYARRDGALEVLKRRTYPVTVKNLQFSVRETDSDGGALLRMDFEIDTDGTKNTVSQHNVVFAKVGDT